VSAIDGRSLRNALGCYATGVAVMATRTAEGAHVAVTVNSFSSVSLDPPLILFSLGNSANILVHFRAASAFTVNILSHSQEAISNAFARPSTAGWEQIAWREADNGCALLQGALAHLECSRFAELDGGDHRILLGRVTQLHSGSSADPLLFFRGRYGTWAASARDIAPAPGGSLSDFSALGWS
jgi:3-hydroxy-9,10-secoandrosta-1,3,5(10)-triene-9,17-dione monooxygenase reductase component